MIHETLALRARRPEAFAGAYVPLPAPPGVCAFTRGDAVAVIVAVQGEPDLDALRLPEGNWNELLTGLPPAMPFRLLEDTAA